MPHHLQKAKPQGKITHFKKKKQETKPLSTEERVWLFIISLYMAVLCVSSFVYWDKVALKVFGVTAAFGGTFMFVASFFDPEARGKKSDAKHPVMWYFVHILIMLGILLCLRLAAGLMTNRSSANIIIYGGLLTTLVIFRKELIQLLLTVFAVLFLFITITSWNDIVLGSIDIKDVTKQCYVMAFRMGPIKDLNNLILTGSYMGYLSKINYHDPEINIKASRIVRGSDDDELEKSKKVLDYVSNSIEYISDPMDGIEFPKKPLLTLSAGAGDCEDQTILLCSMLETVGVKSYIAFTSDHVFALVQFQQTYKELGVSPFLYVDAQPCFALDPSIPNATFGECSEHPEDVEHVFNVQKRSPVEFLLDNSTLRF